MTDTAFSAAFKRAGYKTRRMQAEEILAEARALQEELNKIPDDQITPEIAKDFQRRLALSEKRMDELRQAFKP